MSELFSFLSESPFIGFILICAIYYAFKYTFRHITIWVRGWPPEHLDADGDFKSEKE